MGLRLDYTVVMHTGYEELFTVLVIKDQDTRDSMAVVVPAD